MAISKMKIAFEKIINNKELVTSLINAFLIVGNDDNITEDDIEFMEKYYENDEESIESRFLDEKHKKIYVLSFEKENENFDKKGFMRYSEWKGYKAVYEQGYEKDFHYSKLKRPISIVILDGSYGGCNDELCLTLQGTDVSDKDNPQVTTLSKELFPEYFIMQIKNFKPEEYLDEDKDKMLYLWKYFFATIKGDPNNEDIPKVLTENPIIRKALILCKDDLYDEHKKKKRKTKPKTKKNIINIK